MVASIASRGVAAGRAALRGEPGRTLRGPDRRRAPRRNPEEPAARGQTGRPRLADLQTIDDLRCADAALPAPARAAAAARTFAAGLIVDRLA